MEKIIVYNNPTGPVTEAYRVLCANVLACLEEKKVVEVAGITTEINSSNVIANMAVAMAQTGKKVLIVDCNLHSPKQHELFNLHNSGITDSITSGEDYKPFVQSTEQVNLFVLTSGTIKANNPVEVLLSPIMQKTLADVKEMYDIVLLDVPPVGTISDAIVLGTKTDGIILVITNKCDKVEQLQNLRETFKKAGVNILGLVLDKA